jgi:hypothetical protein
VILSPAQFHEACENLGTDIGCPLLVPVRARLRHSLPPPPAVSTGLPVLPSAAPLSLGLQRIALGCAQPSTQPVGSFSIREHVRVALPSTVLCGAVNPPGSSHAPPQCSKQPPRSGTSQVSLNPTEGAQPTAASNQQPEPTSTAETCATREEVPCCGVHQLFDRQSTSQLRAAVVQDTKR